MKIKLQDEGSIVEKYYGTKSLSDLTLAIMSISAYSGFLRFIYLEVSDCLRFDVGHVSVNVEKSKTDVHSHAKNVDICRSS